MNIISTMNSIKSIKVFKNFLLTHFLLTINILLILIICNCFIVSMWLLYFQKPKFKNDYYSLYIKDKSTILQVGKALELNNAIFSSKVFMYWIKILNVDRKIQAGKFIIFKNDNLWNIIKKITKASEFLDKITIPEGYNLNQIAQTFSKNGMNKDKFIELCKSSVLISNLKLNVTSLEGYLYPDSYEVAYAEDEEKVIKLMVHKFFDVLSKLDVEKSDIYKKYGLYSSLIVASIIEKESCYNPDRPLVSAVFWNRFKKDWRIDSDCTVRYVLNKWSGELLKSDLQYDSPFNTRKYKGLPPTPICSPGKTALKAALFPANTEHMFFIYSGKDDGSSYFSKNLKLHNKTKTKLKQEGMLKP